MFELFPIDLEGSGILPCGGDGEPGGGEILVNISPILK